MTVGGRIAHAREKAGLTQKALADELGLKNYQSISQYERDARNPKPATIRKIADAIGCSQQELTGVATEDSAVPYTIWKNHWPIGEIDLCPWQAEQANASNKEVYFAPKKEAEE